MKLAKVIAGVFVRNVVKFFPASRFFRTKTVLWNLIDGYSINPAARICSSVKIIGDFELKVGYDTFIGHDTFISGGHSVIHIGSKCDISSKVKIVTGTHEITPMADRIAGKGFSSNVIIQDGVWIGVGAIILGGVTIGEKSVVAAGSVVVENIPSYCIAGGIPCKPIKKWDHENKEWKKL